MVVSFIGGGNMTRSLATGLIRAGYPSHYLQFSSTARNQEKADLLIKGLQLKQLSSNSEAAKQAKILILSVKPDVVEKVCKEISPVAQEVRPYVVSLVAGISLQDIANWLNVPNLAVTRVMTNMAINVGQGTTAICANQFTTQAQKLWIEKLFNLVGISYWMNNEDELNKITPLIGCSAANLYLIMEAMQKAAISNGVSEAIVPEIIMQTLTGALELLKQSDVAPEELRRQITTPNGVTAALHKPMFDAGILNLYQDSYKHSVTRCREIESRISPAV